MTMHANYSYMSTRLNNILANIKACRNANSFNSYIHTVTGFFHNLFYCIFFG